MNVRTVMIPAQISLLAAAACASQPPGRDHGRVVAHLAIPFRPAAVTGNTEVIKVSVSPGQRFSVRVDTSDGPYFWNQTGTRPDSRIVKRKKMTEATRSCPAITVVTFDITVR